MNSSKIDDYNDIYHHLKKQSFSINDYEWINKNNNYEDGACKCIGLAIKKGRYADAEFNGYSIELKKGQSIWLDLVRYSELLTGIKNIKGSKDEKSIKKAKEELESAKEKLFNGKSLTIFLITEKDNTGNRMVSRIAGIKTNDIISHVKLDEDMAKKILELQNKLPRQLNAQASMTVNDVIKKAIFEIKFL